MKEYISMNIRCISPIVPRIWMIVMALLSGLSIAYSMEDKQNPLPSSDKKAKWRDCDVNVRVFVSQYGFNPEHPKQVTYPAQAKQFEVRNATDGSIAFTGPLIPISGDFGSFLQGDFTQFKTQGKYYIQIEKDRSPGFFSIRPHLWDELQKSIAFYYFGLRRMGEDNILGNLGDNRLVNWEHGLISDTQGDRYKYIGRAWGDGDDGRVYPSASLVVAQYCALQETNPFWEKGDWIYSQVRWGLDGALSFLEKNGELRYMLHGRDYQNNKYDGRFYTGDEKKVVDFLDQKSTVGEYNSFNLEVIQTSLLLGPAYSVCLYRNRDPDFFKRVETLVKIGYDLIDQRYQPHPQKYSLGSWIWLNLLMWKMTGEEKYKDRAVLEGDRFLALQQTEFVGDDQIKARGWFRKSLNTTANPWGEKPDQEVMITPWIYQGLFNLMEYLPQNPKQEIWRKSIQLYAKDYLMTLAKQNPFDYTPMKVEASASSKLKRKRGNLGYQYFASIGRQFHQIGNAAFLIQAGKILKDEEMIQSGWKQIFWLSGHNPSGYGQIRGFATNVNSGQHFPESLGRSFPGGTVNGAIGDVNDNPNFDRFHEYYTYANLNVLWFSTVAGATKFEDPVMIWPKEISESPHTADPNTHPRASFPVRMKGGFKYQFGGVVRDDPRNQIEWRVNDIPGGDSKCGIITSQGIYTAPTVSDMMKVKVTAVSKLQPTLQDSTEVTLMPAPAQVKGVQAKFVNGKVELSWEPLDQNRTGYTIWKRLPIGKERVGTIFEMVGATEESTTSYVYPNPKIHYYEDDLIPSGTEFMVRAYHRKFGNSSKATSDDMIYGFGPDSAIVTVP